MSSSGDGCLLGRCPPFGELYFVTSHFKPRWGLHNTLPRYEPQFDSRPMQLSCSRCHIIFVEHIGFLIGFDGRYHYRLKISMHQRGVGLPKTSFLFIVLEWVIEGPHRSPSRSRGRKTPALVSSLGSGGTFRPGNLDGMAGGGGGLPPATLPGWGHGPAYLPCPSE